ncbi:unnamed protein product [Lampetra fluviatilis]
MAAVIFAEVFLVRLPDHHGESPPRRTKAPRPHGPAARGGGGEHSAAAADHPLGIGGCICCWRQSPRCLAGWVLRSNERGEPQPHHLPSEGTGATVSLPDQAGDGAASATQPTVRPAADLGEHSGLYSRYPSTAAATGGKIQPEPQPRQPVEDRPGWSRQLGVIQQFASRSGEWCAFVRRFETATRAMRWTEDQALTILPTVLDDPALAVFDRFPAAKRGTLQGVYKEMADVFDPPSGACQRCTNGQREASKSLLVFRTELLTLAEATFPRLNEPALDSLVAERLLTMAQKAGVMLPDRGDIEGLPRSPTRDAPAAEVDEGEMVAALRQHPRIPREAERRPRCWAPRKAGDHPCVTDEVICHRYGREGHIARGCHKQDECAGDNQPGSSASVRGRSDSGEC